MLSQRLFLVCCPLVTPGDSFIGLVVYFHVGMYNNFQPHCASESLLFLLL